MRKTFYTHTDIHDLAKSGVTMLQIDENVVLTMVAKETASKLGLQLVYDNQDTEAAPHRAPVSIPNDVTLEEQVRSAVLKRMGPNAEVNLVNNIISQVMSELESSK
tara:strand:+ start:42 stop:359 length:318 start_codon:yes stop_codon:yes gene_type:complete